MKAFEQRPVEQLVFHSDSNSFQQLFHTHMQQVREACGDGMVPGAEVAVLVDALVEFEDDGEAVEAAGGLEEVEFFVEVDIEGEVIDSFFVGLHRLQQLLSLYRTARGENLLFLCKRKNFYFFLWISVFYQILFFAPSTRGGFFFYLCYLF